MVERNVLFTNQFITIITRLVRFAGTEDHLGHLSRHLPHQITEQHPTPTIEVHITNRNGLAIARALPDSRADIPVVGINVVHLLGD